MSSGESTPGQVRFQLGTRRLPPLDAAPRLPAAPQPTPSGAIRSQAVCPMTSSGRHSGPQGRGGEDPNRRDGSRLGTYPQQMRRRGQERERRSGRETDQPTTTGGSVSTRR